jgi:lipoate-protein ligase A
MGLFVKVKIVSIPSVCLAGQLGSMLDTVSIGIRQFGRPIWEHASNAIKRQVGGTVRNVILDIVRSAPKLNLKELDVRIVIRNSGGQFLQSV